MPRPSGSLYSACASSVVSIVSQSFREVGEFQADIISKAASQDRLPKAVDDPDAIRLQAELGWSKRLMRRWTLEFLKTEAAEELRRAEAESNARVLAGSDNHDHHDLHDHHHNRDPMAMSPTAAVSAAAVSAVSPVKPPVPLFKANSSRSTVQTDVEVEFASAAFQHGGLPVPEVAGMGWRECAKLHRIMKDEKLRKAKERRLAVRQKAKNRRDRTAALVLQVLGQMGMVASDRVGTRKSRVHGSHRPNRSGVS